MDASTKPIEAIRLAMEREKESVHFYSAAVGLAVDPSSRKMFQHLLDEERRHLAILETEYDRAFAKDM